MLPLWRSVKTPGHLRQVILTPPSLKPGIEMARAISSLGVTLLFASLVFLTLGACSRSKQVLREEAPRPGFLVPAGGSLALMVGNDGALTPLDPARTVDPNRIPVPFPMAITAASIQPLGSGAVLAINRTGLLKLRVARRTPANGSVIAEIRLIIEPLPGAENEFAGRTVAPSWSRGSEALFLLFHHPIFELQPPRIPASVVIAATLQGARILEPGIGGDAYALFPVAADSWLAQYRIDSGDRVTTDYMRLNRLDGTSEPLDRAVFERLASPVPIASAPEPLRAAAAELTGPLLIECRLADGSRRTYVRGDPGQAAPAWAQVTGTDTPDRKSFIATDDWRVVTASPAVNGFSATAFNPQPPVSGARIRDAGLVDGLVVALWEEDLFPEVGLSGMLVLDAGL